MQVTSASLLRPLLLRRLVTPALPVGKQSVSASHSTGWRYRHTNPTTCRQITQCQVSRARGVTSLKFSQRPPHGSHTTLFAHTPSTGVNGLNCHHGIAMVTSKMLSSEPLSDSEIRKKVDTITEKFFEARELLEDARAAADTVYFNSDMKEAEEAVADALGAYEQLLESLSLDQRNEVVRTIGLKMEELRAQQRMIVDSVHH